MRPDEPRADACHAARIAMLGELAASIAHEVSQPLAAISACAQASLHWVERGDVDLAEIRELSLQIVSDTRRASEILARIREMATRRDPAPRILDLNALVDEALLVVGPEARRQEVTLVRSLASEVPGVVADRVQLQQVVVNLALNAIEAMAGTQGCRTLEITTGMQAGMVVTRVRDFGPGIAPYAVESIFDGFFTTKENGMGLGLAICRSIVESAGGSIGTIDVGEGACFEFRLPPSLPAAGPD